MDVEPDPSRPCIRAVRRNRTKDQTVLLDGPQIVGRQALHRRRVHDLPLGKAATTG